MATTDAGLFEIDLPVASPKLSKAGDAILRVPALSGYQEQIVADRAFALFLALLIGAGC